MKPISYSIMSDDKSSNDNKGTLSNGREIFCLIVTVSVVVVSRLFNNT